VDDHKLTEIFKTEYSNLVAVLCHYYSVNDIQLAQDIVSNTFLKAMKTWSHNGIPSSPRAWLRKVAKNEMLDLARREKIFQEKVIPELSKSITSEKETEITAEIIDDSQLKMIFVVCNPLISSESQFCLALRILCGFNIEEIARALLLSKEAVNKKLYRAKKSLKDKIDFSTELSTADHQERMPTVLRVIYLLFNEGYYSTVNEEDIREQMCWEAMRLAIFLSRHKHLDLRKTQALIALMCFHTSRLDARRYGGGNLLYDEQDKSMWNQELIAKGNKYLQLSVVGNEISKYHIEASIAYWHTAESEAKWQNILTLYDKLLTLEKSEIIDMNRLYALARADSVDVAIKGAREINLTDNHHYFCLLAELYRMQNKSLKERYYLQQALTCCKKETERLLIQKKLEKVM